MESHLQPNIKVIKYLNSVDNLFVITLIGCSTLSSVCFMIDIFIIFGEIFGFAGNGIKKFYYCNKYWNSPLLFIKDVYPVLILLLTVLSIFSIIWSSFPQSRKRILKKILKISDEEINSELIKIFNQTCKRNIESQTQIIHKVEKEKENDITSDTFIGLKERYL